MNNNNFDPFSNNNQNNNTNQEQKQNNNDSFFGPEYFKKNEKEDINNGFFKQDDIPDPPKTKNGKGLGIASMVCGILSMVLCCGTIYVTMALAIAAIVLAILSKKADEGTMNGFAKAGLIIGIISVVLGVIGIVISYLYLPQLEAIFEKYLEEYMQEESFSVMKILFK